MAALASPTNPFATARALAASSYGVPTHGKLRFPFRNGGPRTIEAFVHDSFRALVLNPQFSCVAAKSAVHNEHYRFAHYTAMSDDVAVEALAHDLYAFTREQDHIDGFSTFVATFGEPVLGEAEFETNLWEVLQRLHELDCDHHAWDPAVSADPDDAHFAFSFAERAFFVVGLHPASSRVTRRFAFPALVFNSHSQFDTLRRDGRYARLQEVIRSRDHALQIEPNPNLADFGERSEAPQYAGRAHDGAWRCPFHRMNRR